MTPETVYNLWWISIVTLLVVTGVVALLLSLILTSARNGHIKSVDFDPVTRVAGALAFHSVVDLKERRVIETNSMATLRDHPQGARS